MKIQDEYYYYQNDHLGTPQKMTAGNGEVVWSAKYNSFGQAEVDPANTVENNLRFAGQYEDTETGLHYNYHRYYDPETGRYLKVDPIGFWGGDENLYAYVLNDPVNSFDPMGLFKCFRGGPPRVVVTTHTVTEGRELFSFKMLHPEGYRASAGGNFPGFGVPPVGPEIAVDWWLWEHSFKEFKEFEITKTTEIVTFWCIEERPCGAFDTFRWKYDQEEVYETKKLIDQYEKWIHKKLYKAGSNSWPLP